MATGLEKIDRGLDRLERLFSRKKRVAEPQSQTGPPGRASTPIPLPPEFDATTQRFPQPSYIRPTSSRMMAREEVLLTGTSTRRARSLPETPRTPRLRTPGSSAYSNKLTGSELSDPSPSVPRRLSSLGAGVSQRSSSLYSDLADVTDTLPELLTFTFPSPPKNGANCLSETRVSRSGLTSSSRSVSVSVSPKAQTVRKQYLADLDDTLPFSLQQGTCAQASPQHTPVPAQRESDCLEHSAGQPFTPSLAPSLLPLSEPAPEKLVYGKIEVPQRPKSLSVSTVDNTHIREALRKSTSLSELLTVRTSASLDSILKEPSVKDFLDLSDDDIADGQAAPAVHPSPAEPPKLSLPRDLSPACTPGWAKSSRHLLTLSPPLASRPAAAAAFEAHRIATKYNLDLVYVVNLWPSHMSRPSRSSPLDQLCGTPIATSPARTTISTPPESPVSCTSGDDSGFDERMPSSPNSTATAPRSGMTGRLLAAYGLPQIMYPFRISAPVHQKILRTTGWLEYRSETGSPDEFARGYSCSFYTGYSPARGRQTTSNSPSAKANRKPANRGIVFAAFRLPLEDGTPVGCDAEELEALHKDAEALVDMLIETHMTQRKQRPAAPALTTPTHTRTRRCVGGGSEKKGRGGVAVKLGPELVAV
ncbi:hypothetical protein VTI74DRAFT_10513 [Chaetomium olivicolor]